MSDLIIQQQENKSTPEGILPDSSSVALETNPSVSGTPLLSWEELIRAERTAGGPAVSGMTGESGSGCEQGCFHPESPPTDAQPLPGQKVRLVGFKKLKSLLQPVHKFFRDKAGFIKQFRLYKDEERELAYPEVKSYSRDNPYRRYQLTHKASARTYKRIRQFVENRKLEDFAMCSMVLTMPKVISEYLAGCGPQGRDKAWRLFDRFWAEDLPRVVNPPGITLASHTNMHLWRTEKPIEPHFHFHTLIPNYGLVDSDIEDDTGEGAAEFVRWQWHKQRGGSEVPFSDSQLDTLKAIWAERLRHAVKRWGLSVEIDKVDIYVEYIDSWQKLHHRFNYNGRHWSENYAEYSNENADCQDPPDWLLNYENRARCKGWWSNLKNITIDKKEDRVKISPYTGKPMEYHVSMNYTELLQRSNGALGYAEFVRGMPAEGVMQENELEWLKGVMLTNESEELDTT